MTLGRVRVERCPLGVCFEIRYVGMVHGPWSSWNEPTLGM